jgi:hypothetical protein
VVPHFGVRQEVTTPPKKYQYATKCHRASGLGQIIVADICEHDNEHVQQATEVCVSWQPASVTRLNLNLKFISQQWLFKVKTAVKQ